MFGFLRKTQKPEDKSVSVSLLGITLGIASDTTIAMRDRINEDWINSVGAQFELSVYTLFKIDYAACRCLSGETRGILMDQCEVGLADVFASTKLGASRESLLGVIASRMDAYGRRTQDQKEFDKVAISLINGLSIYMTASGVSNRVEAKPTIVIHDFLERSNLIDGLISCEERSGGLSIWKFAMKLFQEFPEVLELSGASIDSAWEQIREFDRSC